MRDVGRPIEIMNKFKILVIGCGKIAGLREKASNETHVGAISNMNSLELVACVDSDNTKAERFSKKYRGKGYIDIHQAIEIHKSDIISVCTTDETHFNVVKSIFDSLYLPKIIFIEKPVCKTQEEFEELNNLSKNSQTQVLVNHSRRFDPRMISLKERVSKGEFG